MIAALVAAICAGSMVWLYGHRSVAEFLSGGAAKGASMPLVVLMILLVVGQALTTYTYARLRGRQEFFLAARIAGVSLLLQVFGVIGGSLLFGITGALAGYARGCWSLRWCAYQRCSGRRQSIGRLAGA